MTDSVVFILYTGPASSRNRLRTDLRLALWYFYAIYEFHKSRLIFANFGNAMPDAGPFRSDSIQEEGEKQW